MASNIPITQNLEGFQFPSTFPKENYYLMSNLSLRPEDIIFTTYPKSGTNWVIYIVSGMLNPEVPIPDSKKVAEDFVFADLIGLGRYANSPEHEGRMFFTHIPFDRLQKNCSTKFLTMVRNPMDCCVSFFHFYKELVPAMFKEEDGKDGQEIPTHFFENFIKGKLWYGDYFHHIKESYGRRNDKNVHFMVYEKMKANPREETLKLAKFLGVEKPLEADGGKLLDKIVEQSSFDVMKKTYSYRGTEDPEGRKILRKGKAGGYKKSLTANQISILKELMRKELAGTELLEIWENL